MATNVASAGPTSTSSSDRMTRKFSKVRDLPNLLRVLLKEYGEPGWWTGDAFEVAVGAILTQRTSWRNVDLALENLRKKDLLTPKAIHEAKPAEVQKAIRPAGFYKQKLRYLRAFAGYVVEQYDGRIELMKRKSLAEVREELLEIPGIGPETADSIILYGLGKPSFVVDAYTFRLLDRLGLRPGNDYDNLKARFERELGMNTKRLADMHALIVEHCKRQCTAGRRCGDCCVSRSCPSKHEH